MLLREWRRDSSNKILIFTKSVKLLDMLDYHLNRNGMLSNLIYRLFWRPTNVWTLRRLRLLQVGRFN